MKAADPFTNPAGETRRDRWGRYLVVPPTGGKPTGHTRATTITKTLDDTNSLIPWAGVTGTVGAFSRPGLLAAWQALIAEHGPNPWYGGDDAKRRAKALFEECKEAGGASDRATLGTALHALVERINKGQTVTGVTPDIAADLAAYTATMTAAGIVVDPAMCERIVTLDEWKVAGTADMLAVTVPGYDKPLIADLKTGAEIKWSILAISMQLAIYNHADAIYEQGAAADGSQDVRHPMPDVDRDHALIIHLPAGEARCELHVVDTAAGWEAFQIAMQVREWRSRKNLATVLTIASPDPAPSSAAVEDAAPVPARDVPVPGQPSPDLVAIAEARRTLTEKPDEGADRSGWGHQEDWDDLQRRWNALDDAFRSWAANVKTDAQRQHAGFFAQHGQTERTWHLNRALVTLAEAGHDHDDVIRVLVAHVLDTDVPLMPAISAGHALGSCNAEQAARVAWLADSLVGGTDLSIVYDDGGTPRLHPAAA